MSGRVFLFSDPHFGHTNMALHRGFRNVQEHDEVIVWNWNKVVDKGDVVWILGDITMEKSSPYPILDRLKGIKNVVLGDHDRRQDVPKLLEHVNSVASMVKLGGFILTHCPIHESEITRFKGNIHGHVHENSLPDLRYINVSAEVVGFTPVPLSIFEKRVLKEK